MASVNLSSAIGGNDLTVSDDAEPTTTLLNNGHRTRLVPMFQGLVGIANFVVTKALEAAASATSALNAPGTMATSTTSKLIATGSWAITTQSGKLWAIGQTVVIASRANGLNQMVGIITGYSGTILTVNVASINGSGTFADWGIALTATGGVSITRTVTGGGLVTGGGALSGNLVLTVTAAVLADMLVGTNTTKALTVKALWDALASVAATFASTLTLDFNTGLSFHFTATSNFTLANPTNVKAGQSGRIRIVQDGTGSRTMVLGSAWKHPGGAPSLSTAAGSVDILAYYVHDSSNIECGVSRGYA